MLYSQNRVEKAIPLLSKKAVFFITLSVFGCEVLQVVLVEVFVTRRAENFLRQIPNNGRGSGGEKKRKKKAQR